MPLIMYKLPKNISCPSKGAIMSILGNAFLRMARREHFAPIMSNLAGAFKSFGAVKPMCTGFALPASMGRSFQTSTYAFGTSFVVTDPISTLLGRFKLNSNMVNGSSSQNNNGKRFEWSSQSKVSVAAAALAATAYYSSTEKVQCAGGARPEVYALSQAGMFFYAGLMSFRAIQSDDPKDDKQWLTFWLLFSVFELAATVTDVLLGWIIPYYNELKCGFLFFLGVFGGAEYVYPFLEPLLLKADQVQRKYISRIAPSGFPGFTPVKPSTTAAAETNVPPLKPSNSFRAVSRS